MKNVLIEPVLNGFVVTVGCQKVVFESVERLWGELKRYQKEPGKVEKEYLDGGINRVKVPDFGLPNQPTTPEQMAGQVWNNRMAAGPRNEGRGGGEGND